ncbi:hypothetical protein Adt_13492 [Abeliophyllum distichum]|uniref:Uncharacterized protein n=1 Tax=Abeliophyllum distichum TaxID=126358 RepID=A0ABD1TWY8_9LAMI
MMQSCNPRARRPADESKPPKFNAIMINCSCLIAMSTASLKGLSHWDSATLQLAPPVEHSFAQRASPTGTRLPCNLPLPWSKASLKVPLPLRFGHLAACSSHRAQLRSSASPTGTRPPCSLLLPWSTASLKGPLPLGLSHLAACSSQKA